MEKKPILGRFILVAIIGVVALLQWWPEPLGEEMVEVFKTKLRTDVEVTSIIDRLEATKSRKAQLRPPEELTLEDWTTAIGEGTDLRDLIQTVP